MAFSRVGGFEGLKELALQDQSESFKEFQKKHPGVYTRNVVYKEVVDKAHV